MCFFPSLHSASHGTNLILKTGSPSQSQNMAGSNPWRYYVLNHIDEKREIVQFASGSPPRKARMLISQKPSANLFSKSLGQTSVSHLPESVTVAK